eukprot:TRINITY_DN809_c0_g2_i4.p1 TRINITY_DN809_c0_g2~~TRINITY_DN809_c0_g2_i4.p1  ORF type:complete len:325 (-),score=44.16 TRINITY_DN809_c0_g2_i4:111-1085(-)
MSIFVSIPSYRDSECQHTIASLFEQAIYPELVFVGVLHQCDVVSEDSAKGNDETNEQCEDMDCFLIPYKYPHNVREKRIHWRNASGPCKARSIIQQELYNGEEYYLQIDSHMRFLKGWDVLLKKWHSQCSYQQPNLIPTFINSAFLVAKGFDARDNMLRLEGKILAKEIEDSPLPSYFWVSGFAFSKADVIPNVPYNDNLEHLFFGEEMVMNCRLWTSGYDFFCAAHTVIYHLWDRSYRKTFRETFDEDKSAKEKESRERVWKILRGVSDEENCGIGQKYGLGKARTLEDYSLFCGVDFFNHKLTEKSKNGGLDPRRFLNPKKK